MTKEQKKRFNFQIGGYTPKIIEEIADKLSKERRELMEKYATPFVKDEKERYVFIEQSLISYEAGVYDGIREYIETQKNG